MKCDSCGTEDPGAPSYKPACLIERDAALSDAARLREALRQIENITGICDPSASQGDMLQIAMWRARTALAGKETP